MYSSQAFFVVFILGQHHISASHWRIQVYSTVLSEKDKEKKKEKKNISSNILDELSGVTEKRQYIKKNQMHSLNARGN